MLDIQPTRLETCKYGGKDNSTCTVTSDDTRARVSRSSCAVRYSYGLTCHNNKFTGHGQGSYVFRCPSNSSLYYFFFFHNNNDLGVVYAQKEHYFSVRRRSAGGWTRVIAPLLLNKIRFCHTRMCYTSDNFVNWFSPSAAHNKDGAGTVVTRREKKKLCDTNKEILVETVYDGNPCLGCTPFVWRVDWKTKRKTHPKWNSPEQQVSE